MWKGANILYLSSQMGWIFSQGYLFLFSNCTPDPLTGQKIQQKHAHPLWFKYHVVGQERSRWCFLCGFCVNFVVKIWFHPWAFVAESSMKNHHRKYIFKLSFFEFFWGHCFVLHNQKRSPQTSPLFTAWISHIFEVFGRAFRALPVGLPPGFPGCHGPTTCRSAAGAATGNMPQSWWWNSCSTRICWK